jgi:predicted secreted hydrolase
MRVYFRQWILGLSAVTLLAAPTSRAADFAPVVPGRTWSFPRDHGAHPDFKTEWWYFTGHLSDPSGRTFGFQWTVFRSAVAPEAAPSSGEASAWRASQLYFGHAAVSDLEPRRFFYAEEAARGALGLAAASPEKFQIHLPGFAAKPDDGLWRLQAHRGDLDLELSMPAPPEVLPHGQAGYSPKAEESGYASYYYSVPRLPLHGSIRIQKRSYTVTGEAWMDHEFGSGQLASHQSGWDWLGLPLGGKAALMVYRLRDRRDPQRDFLSGTYVDGDGNAHPLKGSDLRLTASAPWRSPRTGATYPLEWRVEIPAQGVELRVTAAFPDQELDTRRSTQVIYWEGSVTVKGKIAELAVDSRGYLEMTGYAEP